MSGAKQNSSGQFQGMPVPQSKWIDEKTGFPTPQFYQAIYSLWIRTGGAQATASGGELGLPAVAALAQEALSVGALALLDNPDSLSSSSTLAVQDPWSAVLALAGAPDAPEWVAGFVSGLGSGLTLAAGVLDVELSIKQRTLLFSLVGLLPGGQTYNLTMTQAGVLLANGGVPKAYIPTNPAATQVLTLNTIHAGIVTTQGTISISTSGVVTWPSFSAVALAAGDTVQLHNQALADITFANACFSLQVQIN